MLRARLGAPDGEAVLTALTTVATLQRKLLRLEKIHRVFHQWHIVHLPFAVIMYLIMALHIAVAGLYGMDWR